MVKTSTPLGSQMGNCNSYHTFSIVPPTIPFLVSKFVIKRLGGVLDLDANEFVLKKAKVADVAAVEPLYDLVSGHVGVELTKVGIEPPVVSREAMDLCRR